MGKWKGNDLRVKKKSEKGPKSVKIFKKICKKTYGDPFLAQNGKLLLADLQL